MESLLPMSGSFPWRTAFRIAWRESRASAAKFLFVMLAVAVGVGSLTGVRGFSRAFRSMLLRDARTLMAADLSVRVFDLPAPDQDRLLTKLESEGIDRTWVTETVSMLNEASLEAPLLVAVKAVDPAKYPFYGEVKTLTGKPLATLLQEQGVAVSDDLLVRTGLKEGARIRIGSLEFTIRGTLTYEPDRMSGSINVGPRVMMTRENLEKAGLLLPGSRSAQRFLFKFPAAQAESLIGDVRKRIQSGFPNAVISDFRQTHPLITRGLDNATTFLSLVSLIALVVGAVGVAMAIQSHLQQKMDSIAVMKALGGRSGQILKIYLLQASLIAIGGGLAGILLGWALQQIFPIFIARFFPIAPQVNFELRSVAEGLGLALLSTFLFVLPPLLGIRQVKPVLIFRRDMEGAPLSLSERWRQWRAAIAATLLIFFGLAGIAIFLIDAGWALSARLGGWFVAGLAGAFLILIVLSWALLRLLRMLLRTPLLRLPALTRHGLANLYRPGNRAEAVLVAFSLGVMFTLSVYLLQHSLIGEIEASAPPGMPNIFLINITNSDREAVTSFLRNWPGVVGDVTVIATGSGILKSVDGKPITEETLPNEARRYLSARSLTWSREIPSQSKVLAGNWWSGTPPEPQLSVLASSAGLLRIRPGMMTEWDVAGRRIRARVAALHRNESVRPGANSEFIFSPGALDNVPVLYFGAARVNTESIAKLQKASFQRFPAITVINLSDVLDRVQEVIDQVAIVVRFISAFAIAAGVIILASSIAGSRLRRIREVVILKTLGATKAKVAAIFSVEFLVLGLIGGAMGSVLAIGFTNLLLSRLLEADFRFEPLPNIIAIAGSGVVALAAGWLASFRILDQKPLAVLREE
jgi:putative ABC transport system permease protein